MLFLSMLGCEKPLPTSPNIISAIQPPPETQIDEKKKAILKIIIIPGKGLFADNPEYPVFAMQFTIVAKETNGVGGRINSFLVEAWDNENCLHSESFQAGAFKPLCCVSRYCLLIFRGQPDRITIQGEGIDDNGHEIKLMYSFDV